MNHVPEISVRFISPGDQRLCECGDWFFDADQNLITVFVNLMEDWRSELAVACHEIFESVCYLQAGKDQTDVDFFDKKFYLEHDEGEAGDSTEAPYHDEHLSATLVEREVCSRLQLGWEQHEKNCDK